MDGMRCWHEPNQIQRAPPRGPVHLVGGVNSPVRAFKSVHGNPIYFEKASGAHVTDVDGNLLVDFVQSWGPLIHGHSHPEIIAAVHEKC